MKTYKQLFSSIMVFLSICSTSLNAASKDDEFLPKSANEFVPVQKKYDELGENIPSYIMIHATGSGMMSQEILDAVQDKLNRSMVKTEKLKPVLLDKWLYSTYSENKASDIQSFINTLSQENYPVNMEGVCHPYIFKVSDGYVIILSFYRFSDNGIPVQTLRKIRSLSECSKAFDAMVSEYLTVTATKKKANYKKVVVKPFTLENRKYNVQSSGDFDYIPSPFIEQDGVLIRSNDDYFSRLFSYSLCSTQMVKSISCLDLEQYVNENFSKVENSDYYIEGRVQLTDQINIFHIALKDSRTDKTIQTVKYFSSEFSVEGIIYACNSIICSLADSIFGKENYGICPLINVPGQGLFLNDNYIGWDRLENFVLPKGKHIIYTGDYFKKDPTYQVKNKNKNVDINGEIYRSFFVYLEERNWLFRGKDGERVWNLLEK